MNWLMRPISVDRGLVAIGRQRSVAGAGDCCGVHPTACVLAVVDEAGVAGAMGGIGAIDWVSVPMSSLGDRAEAGTAIAAKNVKIGPTPKAFWPVCRRLDTDKAEASLSSHRCIAIIPSNNAGLSSVVIASLSIRS